ncbi:MAG: hypothetical protein Q9217_006787 [Psora testacea]
MGILLGVFIILWSGLTAGLGLYLQTKCARYLDRGSASFFALSQITYPNAAVVFDAAIAIKCFGVGVSYLIIIGDLMPGVVRGFSEDGGGVGFLIDRHFWVTGFMLIVIPLSFLRRLDSLKYTSVIALISIGYLVILVVAHFASGDTMQDRGVIRILRWDSAVAALSSFPVIVFAYTCHQNMFSVLNEIGNNAPSITSTVGKAAIVVLVMFSYPLQVHPCRASVDAVLKWRPHRRQDGHNDSPARQSPLMPTPSRPRGDGIGETRFAAITTAIIVLSYIVAMTVSSLEKVLAYVGSTGSTSISFILPGLFYYKISSPTSPHHQKLMKEDDDEPDGDDGDEDDGLLGGGGLKAGPWRKKLLRRLSLALAIYGVVVMITCLITNTVFVVGPH